MGAPHLEAVQLFCSRFDKCYLENGLPCRRRVEAVEKLACAWPSKLQNGPAARGQDFEALGRLILHCRFLGVPTALGLSPAVYGRALGHREIDSSDWGEGKTLAQIKRDHDPFPQDHLNEMIGWLNASLPIDSPERDCQVLKTWKACEESGHPLAFEDSNGEALCQDGSQLHVDAVSHPPLLVALPALFPCLEV